MKQIPSPLQLAISATFIMAIGMGFGRFAFTAIYPHMVEEKVLSLSAGGIAASINYAGYLLGALISVKIRAYHAHYFCLWSIIGTIFCLGILSTPHSVITIILIRGIAGVFSALAMVSASLWLLSHHKLIHFTPFLYSGVGLGIFLSAELIVVGTFLNLSSQGLWLLLALFSVFIGLFTVRHLIIKTAIDHEKITIKPIIFKSTITQSLPIIIIYGLAGFGYIITATYLPLLVKHALPNLDSAHVWAIFGLSAIPSCFIWHKLHQHYGTRIALSANLIIQAFGVILPNVSTSTFGYLLSAFLVGGTFMGTVTITMPVAQSIAKQTKRNLLAIMTIFFSIGQIMGPLVTNTLFAITHSFNSALYVASIALLIASLISIKSNLFLKFSH
ncbi:MFS transporter [Acinetobacter sp. ANC 4558]|uniref:YbfB/YjiJ family MFS transporter n=1 Tax=Acinetobacter sp. ANC 4558 TaxID=1977876 RepID=UPI000B7651A4|nr:YbfB/YjiJ family MFS transporter [Acinetobacter sp. ANC 4558]OTG86455.1 MFS transporter [Acinetobacter sp. ANC 4558]